MRAGLYLHFPFCLKKCLYCDFNSSPARELDHRDYVTLLLREMELREALLPEPVRAETFYLGGGTPSLLDPAQVSSLIDAASRRFGLAADAEVTLEANPGTVTPEKLAGYRQAGVNRLSLGVQSLEDRLLSRLGRVHTAGEALGAFAAARRAGFTNISLDLMHGLPGQTLPQWREALAAAIALGAEHLSAYALSVEEGTPFASLLEKGELQLPSEEEGAQMFEATAELLTGAGYLHYEISNFARPGYESRHNSAYWSRRSYLGFGAGAHSLWNDDAAGTRWHNPRETGRYGEGIRGGKLPEEEREELTVEQAVAESFFLGLRMLGGVELAPLEARFGRAQLAHALAEAARLEAGGALIREAGRLRLAPSAVIVANSVFSRFL